MDVAEQTTGITGLRFAGRCKPIPGSCGKNILFFTPVETQAQQSPAPVSRTASLRDSRATLATITCSPQVNQRNDVASRAQHAIASASRSVHRRDELVRSVGLTPYPFLGSSKTGGFCRRLQGRIHAVPRNGYGVSLTSTRYSITIGACRD
jgi:hypothetical protein